MSESRPKKHKIEFIESYWTGGEIGSDYQWNDNHGELIRCKDCKWFEMPRYGERGFCKNVELIRETTFYCADGERREPE